MLCSSSSKPHRPIMLAAGVVQEVGSMAGNVSIIFESECMNSRASRLPIFIFVGGSGCLPDFRSHQLPTKTPAEPLLCSQDQLARAWALLDGMVTDDVPFVSQSRF